MYFSTALVLSLSSVALARPLRYQRRAAALDTGSCGSPEIQFANGLDGRNEPSFQAVNQQDFNHGSALNIGVIANFVCGQLQSACKAAAATVTACDQATQAAAQATGGAAADAFNSALGITSDFAAGAANGTADAAEGADAAAAGANATAAASTANAAAADPTANATAAAGPAAADPAAASNATATAAGAALDTGSCGSPEIQFADGLDGRNEASFQAVNQQDFNHGSALNIGVIANFVCGQLSSKCKASAATTAACDQGTQAAAQATGGAAADAFNAALGITSDFAGGAADGAAAGAAASNATAADASTAAAANSAAGAAASTATAAADAAAASSTASTGAAAAAAGNLQTFTGSLGATAPAVTASGNGQFQVDGNASFNNEQNALVRDVQHNQCANAANASGNSGALTVAACATQQDQCNAAAQSTAAA